MCFSVKCLLSVSVPSVQDSLDWLTPVLHYVLGGSWLVPAQRNPQVNEAKVPWCRHLIEAKSSLLTHSDWDPVGL